MADLLSSKLEEAINRETRCELVHNYFAIGKSVINGQLYNGKNICQMQCKTGVLLHGDEMRSMHLSTLHNDAKRRRRLA